MNDSNIIIQEISQLSEVVEIPKNSTTKLQSEEVARDSQKSISFSSSTTLNCTTTYSFKYFRFWSIDGNKTKVKEDLKVTLLNVQNKISQNMEQYKAICGQFEFLWEMLQQMLYYLETVKLNISSSKKLTNLLSIFIGTYQKSGTETGPEELLPETNYYQIIDELRNIIINFLEENSFINKLKIKVAEYHEQYEIATKNFNIILEHLNLEIKDMRKLSRQYEGVISKHQENTEAIVIELSAAVPEMRQLIHRIIDVLRSRSKVYEEFSQKLYLTFEKLYEAQAEF